ncbi:MAG TPA: hypothetical protein VGL15_13660 [Vicinamibacteria bacterium]
MGTLLPSNREAGEVQFEDFKAVVRDACESGASGIAGLASLPALRRRCSSLSPEQFDAFVFQLQEEGTVHLLTHVDATRLSQADRDDAVRHSSGLVLYWVRWV